MPAPVVDSSSKEIDDLFGEFDAALDAVSGGGTTSSVTTGAEAAKVSSAPAAGVGADASDLFGDADDFMRELEK